MRTNVRETSKSAFRAITFDGVTARQELEILRCMCETPKADWTLQELSKATGIAINAVSGRVNALKGRPPYHVIESNKRQCHVTGRTVIPVALSQRQGSLWLKVS